MSDRPTVERAHAIERVRARVRIDLEPTEPDTEKGERIAFDVVVAIIGQVGRWAELAESRGVVVWTDGRYGETPGAGDDPASVVPALRETVPVTDELLSAFRSQDGGNGARGLVG